MNTNNFKLIGLAFLLLALCFACNKEASLAPQDTPTQSFDNAQDLESYFFPKSYKDKSRDEMRALFTTLDEETKVLYKENYRIYNYLLAFGQAETAIEALAEDELLTDLDLSTYLSEDQLQAIVQDEPIATQRATCLIELWRCESCIGSTVYVTAAFCCYSNGVCGPTIIRSWTYPASPFCFSDFCTG